MTLINHPETFMVGHRVLMLKSRHKDGHKEERQIVRVSRSEKEFKFILHELNTIAQEGERIYATAGTRCCHKAGRLLQQRILDNHYDKEPGRFYDSLIEKWVSCLMKSPTRVDKRWLFDFDDPGLYREFRGAVWRMSHETYDYETKNGYHIVARPFNTYGMPDYLHRIRHKDALMLWRY